MNVWLKKIDGLSGKCEKGKIAALYRLCPENDAVAPALFRELEALSLSQLNRRARKLPAFSPFLSRPMMEVVGDAMDAGLVKRRPGCALEMALTAMIEGITPSEITREVSQMKTLDDIERFMNSRKPRDVMSVQMQISDTPAAYEEVRMRRTRGRGGDSCRER